MNAPRKPQEAQEAGFLLFIGNLYRRKPERLENAIKCDYLRLFRGCNMGGGKLPLFAAFSNVKV